MESQQSTRFTLPIPVVIVLVVAGLALNYWFEHHQRHKGFDATLWLKKSFGRGELIEATAVGVAPDGIVQPDGELSARFIYAPLDGGAPDACAGGVLRTRMEYANNESWPRQKWSEQTQRCGAKISQAPHCSFAQVWQKAKAKGVPASTNAEITLTGTGMSTGPEGRWRFEIVDRHGDAGSVVLFGADFDDDC